MKSRLAWTLGPAAVAFLALGALVPSAAHAQAALDDDDDATAPVADPTPASAAEDPNAVHIGLGLRLRNVRVPQSLIELFVDRSPGGSSEFGYGLEVARRRGSFEIQFGLEHDSIYIEPGYWIEKSKPIPANEPDYVKFDNFGWWSAEVTFLNHSEIIPQLSVRYGGGAGIAIVTGDVNKQDATCATADLDTCTTYTMPKPYDIPPVMLIVNAIVGVQVRPMDHLFINIEGGIRTLPFFGTTLGYYF